MTIVVPSEAGSITTLLSFEAAVVVSAFTTSVKVSSAQAISPVSALAPSIAV